MNYVCNGSYKSFVCLDFETTGLSGTKDNVTEIGAVKVLDGEVVQRFSTLSTPDVPIPPKSGNPYRYHQGHGRRLTPGL